MGFSTISVVPKDSTEVNASVTTFACPVNTVGFRVNDVSVGTSVQVVTAGGTTVTYDNLSNGEDIVLEIGSIVNTGTTCTSIHIFHD